MSEHAMTIDRASLSPRQLAYLKLCERHGIVIGDDSSSAGEDAALYFSYGGEPPDCVVERFAAVTVAGDFRYAYPDFSTLADAAAGAVKNIADDVFMEAPLCVADLDTGERFYPQWDTLQWLRSNNTSALQGGER
jgi:hypothetical protein